MIPLSRWLVDREALVSHALPHEADAGQTDSVEVCVPPSPTDLAFERGYCEGQAEAEARLSDLRNEDCQTAALREKEMTAKWALSCSEALSSGVATALAQLHSSIERNLHEVLLPFVADAIRHRAIEALLRLTTSELSRKSDPPLEIRAPAAVLNPLRDELGRLGIAAVLVEDHTVELRTKGLSTVFESMCGRWIETLREAAGHE